MAFRNNNVVRGLPPNGGFQVGNSDVDPDLIVERNVGLPTTTAFDATWLYFDCTIRVVLDSGVVVHNRLPQIDNTADSLSVSGMDNPDFDKLTGGVNLKCFDRYQDVVQRMGHARYWFNLSGQALRVSQRVPIPGIKSIGGVPAIPYDNNPQQAFNSIVPGGNYGGSILWRAGWSLWYTIASPPVNQDIPAADPSAHISSLAPTPREIQSPYSQADDNSVLGGIGGQIGAAVGALGDLVFGRRR